MWKGKAGVDWDKQGVYIECLCLKTAPPTRSLLGDGGTSRGLLPCGAQGV